MLVLLGALLLTFCVLEVAFRISHAVRDRRLEARALRGETWAIYDADLGYRLRPRPGRPLGLKSAPIKDKDDSRTRVLFLGDSIPHGGRGRAETLVAHAQRALDRRRTAAELINAGVPGYTTYQELLFLEKFGLSLEPDVVVLCFCVD